MTVRLRLDHVRAGIERDVVLGLGERHALSVHRHDDVGRQRLHSGQDQVRDLRREPRQRLARVAELRGAVAVAGPAVRARHGRDQLLVADGGRVRLGPSARGNPRGRSARRGSRPGRSSAPARRRPCQTCPPSDRRCRRQRAVRRGRPLRRRVRRAPTRRRGRRGTTRAERSGGARAPLAARVCEARRPKTTRCNMLSPASFPAPARGGATSTPPADC
jgi:hypothetical protein